MPAETTQGFAAHSPERLCTKSGLLYGRGVPGG